MSKYTSEFLKTTSEDVKAELRNKLTNITDVFLNEKSDFKNELVLSAFEDESLFKYALETYNELDEEEPISMSDMPTDEFKIVGIELLLIKLKLAEDNGKN